MEKLMGSMISRAQTLKSRRRQRHSGQAIVEMAFLLPFFLLIVVGGIIDFGFAFYHVLTIQEMANDAALFAAESKPGGQSSRVVESYILEKKPVWLNGFFQTIATTTEIASGVIGEKVLLSYDYPLMTPFWQTTAQAFTGNATMRVAAMAVYQVPNRVVTR
ncbi:MAG: TadE family protein [Candidatus Ozemobacteraceae bacterium]